jgi:BCD family chlorophyll transporter-like MFS transporter
VVGLGPDRTAYGIAYVDNPTLALITWIAAYAAIGLGIGAAGTSFLALLATAAPTNARAPPPPSRGSR